MKIKVYAAEGIVLDWLVTSIEKPEACEYGVADWREQRSRTVRHGEYLYRWFSSWAQGGPIIEREKLSPQWDKLWKQWTIRDPNNAAWSYLGETFLIAAMRCYVASKLGDEVDVPEGLV